MARAKAAAAGLRRGTVPALKEGIAVLRRKRIGRLNDWRRQSASPWLKSCQKADDPLTERPPFF